MAVKNFTITKQRGRIYSIGLFDSATNAAHKLTNGDITSSLELTGVYSFVASATFVKGNAATGQLVLVVDGVEVKTSGDPTSVDGAPLSITWTGAVASSVHLKAVITGESQTGASINYARLGAYDATIR